MKKTLVAVSVLGAFAGSALAADVQLYGILDTGVGYSHIDMDTSGVDDVDSFEMKSGVGSGSRWGLKGTEDLGNGLTVGFILENALTPTTVLKTPPVSCLTVNQACSWKVVSASSLLAEWGALNSGQSSWSKVGMINAFGTSYGEFTAQASNVFSLAGQWDNMIAYETPDFAGFKLFTQYGMGSNDNENESSSNRFYSLGVTYNNGPFAGYFAVDSINYKTAKFSKGEWPNNGDDIDDSLTVTLGGSYDFDVVKIYLGAQYFDEVRLSSLGGPICRANDVRDLGISGFDLSINDIAKLKGYGISLSGDAPLAGGRVMFGLGYVDADAADSLDKALSQNIAGFRDFEIQRYVVSAGYSYPFSKRTDVYGVASYMQDNEDTSRESGTLEQDPSAYSFYVGLRHRF